MCAGEKRQLLPWQIIQKFFALPLPSNYPRNSVSSGWQRFLAEDLLSALISNLAQTHLNVKYCSWSGHKKFPPNFLCYAEASSFKRRSEKRSTTVLALSLANKGNVFPNLLTEPVKRYDYLPGCLALPGDTMSDYCTAPESFYF